MPSFEQVAAAVAGVPFMSPEQGRVIHDHVAGAHARDVLELGTAHGVGAAYPRRVARTSPPSTSRAPPTTRRRSRHSRKRAWRTA